MVCYRGQHVRLMGLVGAAGRKGGRDFCSNVLCKLALSSAAPPPNLGCDSALQPNGWLAQHAFAQGNQQSTMQAMYSISPDALQGAPALCHLPATMPPTQPQITQSHIPPPPPPQAMTYRSTILHPSTPPPLPQEPGLHQGCAGRQGQGEGGGHGGTHLRRREAQMGGKGGPRGACTGARGEGGFHLRQGGSAS